MPAEVKTYTVEPVDGRPSYIVQADKYEYDTVTGRHLFFNGDSLVANLINVSVRQEVDDSSDASSTNPA